MNKKIFSFVLATAIGILLFSSCDKIKSAINLDIPINPQDIEFTIPIISATGAVTLSDVDIAINIDSIIKANNAELATKNIKSVKLKSCTFTMVDGDIDNNFSALESVNVKFASNVNGSEINLIDITNNPDVEAYTLEVPVDAQLDLKDYFDATSFSYSVSGNARKTTTKPIQCKVSIRYSMNVGL